MAKLDAPTTDIDGTAYQYDYTNQAWVINGLYVRCGHSLRPPCGCYGTIHAGSPAVEDADIF